MMSARSIFLLIGIYFAILLYLAPVNILSFDTYYYWDWSRHLALSYYDGSPMIAYLIRLSTLLFGDSLFALNLIGIGVMALVSGIIYKTARFFLSKEASCIATLSWLFAPLTTLDILKQTTYDTPLVLFWALTLYYCAKWIHTNKIKELYLAGASAGLMLLSKYSGIVLILSILIFLMISPYRRLFKSKHFLFATLLALLIFSPVLVWNYNNHWISFIYQLTTHKLNHVVNPFYQIIKTFFTLFIPSLNIMLLLPLLIRTRPEDKNASIVRLCCTVCVTFFCFYLVASSNTLIREFWLTPYLISAAPLFGYCYERSSYPQVFIALIVFYAVISLSIFIDNTSKYNLTTSKKLVLYRLVEQLNASSYQIPDTVFTSGWFQARMLFFLKNKPEIYTLGCGTAQNQYELWGTDMNRKIADKSVKEALFIDKYDRLSCLTGYFDQCTKIPTDSYQLKHKEYALNVYKCRNF